MVAYTYCQNNANIFPFLPLMKCDLKLALSSYQLQPTALILLLHGEYKPNHEKNL